MAALNETPSANRVHIAFFGLRNAGKSTLVNAFCGQDIAIVSDVAGTTTDPVSKAMEILPLGPCLITDTAGLDDDAGELGALRVKKTLAVLATTDIAIWVDATAQNLLSYACCSTDPKNLLSYACCPNPADPAKTLFLAECQARHVTTLEYHRGDSVDALKAKIAALKLTDDTPGLLDGLVSPGDRVICVCPIDESAPKGRLILPQVQVVRACLDLHVPCTVVQPSELADEVGRVSTKPPSSVGRVAPRLPKGKTLVITDSQAFDTVRTILAPILLSYACCLPSSPSNSTSSLHPSSPLTLTSFSILFARQKGDLNAFLAGLSAVSRLHDGDTILIAEGCTHHRQCNDIGSVKIPKALEKLSGKKLNFVFSSGNTFSLAPSLLSYACCPTPDAPPPPRLSPTPTPALVVHCGGCMLTRREVLRRIGLAQDAQIPILNYGLLLAAAHGLDVQALAAPLVS